MIMIELDNKYEILEAVCLFLDVGKLVGCQALC